MSEDYPEYIEEEVTLPRLKSFLYKHTHACPLQGENFRYNPPTQGAHMFPVTPVCVYANVELELLTVEDV